MEEEQLKESLKEQPKYDPSKQYRWEIDTSFILSGQEFGDILNTLRTILNSPEAKKIFLVQKANKIIEDSLARSVEFGLVKEVPNDQIPTPVNEKGS